MKNKNIDTKLIKLYSSVNFADSKDSKKFGKWDIDSKLKILIHFMGEYMIKNQPNIYFKSKVTLDVRIDKNGIVHKSNIIVRDVCFKNEFNVSASSITEEYQYLYNISCSSADNNDCSSNSKKSTCSASNLSSKISLSNIIANGIEKKIIIDIKSFIESNAFKINWVLEQGYFILDVKNFNNGKTFPNAKMNIKYKLIKCSSTSSSSTCSSSSSTKPNCFVKILIMGFVALLIIMFLLKLLKDNNCETYNNAYNNLYNNINSIIYKKKEDKQKEYITEPDYINYQEK